MTTESSSDLSISVPISTKAKARRIHRLNRRVFWELDQCFNFAEQWDSLTPVQKIQLEQLGTEKLLELLELYNRYVSHSIHYRLREKTPEEEDEEQEEEVK